MPNVDDLFAEQENENLNVPKEVIDLLEEIMIRNDRIGLGSRKRVSRIRAIQWIESETGCKLTKEKIDKITEKLGRKSWAYA